MVILQVLTQLNRQLQPSPDDLLTYEQFLLLHQARTGNSGEMERYLLQSVVGGPQGPMIEYFLTLNLQFSEMVKTEELRATWASQHSRRQDVRVDFDLSTDRVQTGKRRRGRTGGHS